MCYLCDMCAHFKTENAYPCRERFYRYTKVAIDYGKDDPKDRCQHFEPKAVSAE